MKNNAADRSQENVTTQETQPISARASEINRRQFLTAAAKGLGAAALLSSGMPKGWIGGAYADEGPETSNIKFGMIALTDCSPIVIAHEKGFFRKYGINSTVSKGANWAAIRDALSNSDIQATHMLIGMPIASTMGAFGFTQKTYDRPLDAESQRPVHHLESRLERQSGGRSQSP